MYLKTGILALTLLLSGTIGSTQAPRFSIDDLGWLKGCWASTSDGTDLNEQWMAPAGKTMLGMSRTVAAGKTVEFEFLQIRTDDKGDIDYIARPSGQPEASFKLVKLASQEAVFENPSHDFPQRVIYRLERDGSLFARIEGVNKGKERGINFPMKRARCD